MVKVRNKGSGRRCTKFHCPTDTCAVSFVRRRMDNHTKAVTDEVVRCVV